MFPTRTKEAYLRSAASLWQPGLRVYFWTFTFLEANADYIQSEQFSTMLELWRQYGIFPEDGGGVRVAHMRQHDVCLVYLRIKLENYGSEQGVSRRVHSRSG